MTARASSRSSSFMTSPYLYCVKEHFRDEVIHNLTPKNYLIEMLGQTQRLPCFCSEMADVSAILYSQMINKPVYSLRNIFVNYLYLPRPWHCINAVVEDERIRYFDISAYAQVLDRKRRKVVKPAEFVVVIIFPLPKIIRQAGLIEFTIYQLNVRKNSLKGLSSSGEG